MSKQNLNFKLWLQKQKNHFIPLFWRKIALWTSAVAEFSQRKADALEQQSPRPTIPASVEKLLLVLRGEIRQSRKLFLEKQAETHNKITLLESKLLPSVGLPEKNSRERTDSPKSKAPLERITIELSHELRDYLESHSLFDQKSWQALWQGEPAPCELAKRLLCQYPPLEACTTEIYEGIAIWLKKVSGQQEIHLIIPTLNQEFDSNQHELVKQLQQKGLANRVQDVKRPGLACDETVLVKAQVVST